MLIVSYPANQLGNALRAVLSTKILADAMGADFAIDFGGRGFFSKRRCSRLAEKTLRMLLPDHVRVRPPPEIRELDEQQCMRFIDLYGTNSDPVLEAVFKPGDGFPKEGFGLCHIYSAKPDGMTDDDYLRTKQGEYGKMAFPAALKKVVSKFCRTWDLANAIGMHIRYTDNLQDRAKASLNTPLDVFEKRLRAVTAARGRVLLCTDNEKVRDRLTAAYPESIILPNSVGRNFQALYEMMLLAETKCVAGTYGSTFSYEACLFKGTDLELFENGDWKRYGFSSLRGHGAPHAVRI